MSISSFFALQPESAASENQIASLVLPVMLVDAFYLTIGSTGSARTGHLLAVVLYSDGQLRIVPASQAESLPEPLQQHLLII